MENDSRPFNSSKRLSDFIKAGMAFTICVLGIFLNLDKFSELLNSNILNAILVIALIFFVLISFILWVMFGGEESQRINQFLYPDNGIPYIYKILSAVVPFIIGIIFGLLIVFSSNIEIFLIIIIVLTIITSISDNQVTILLAKYYSTFIPCNKEILNRDDNKNVESVVELFKDLCSDNKNATIYNIYSYYFLTKYFSRHILTLASYLLALLISITNSKLGELDNIQLSYIITLGTIIFSELSIWRWRINNYYRQ